MLHKSHFTFFFLFFLIFFVNPIGLAQFGSIRFNRFDMVWLSLVKSNLVRSSPDWFSIVWFKKKILDYESVIFPFYLIIGFSSIQFVSVRFASLRSNLVLFSLIWFGLVRFDLVLSNLIHFGQSGPVRFNLVWFGSKKKITHWSSYLFRDIDYN